MNKEANLVQAEEKVEGCCGGPAPADTEACCVADADAKAAGDDGCGCGTEQESAKETQASSCC